jgi:hypothetical protein
MWYTYVGGRRFLFFSTLNSFFFTLIAWPLAKLHSLGTQRIKTASSPSFQISFLFFWFLKIMVSVKLERELKRYFSYGFSSGSVLLLGFCAILKQYNYRMTRTGEELIHQSLQNTLTKYPGMCK